MRYCTLLIVFGLGVRCAHCFWPPAYKVDLSDRKMFIIASDEKDYEDENGDEMIRTEDLAEFKSLADDEEKFKPLHSHVESYNKRAARTATEFSYLFPDSLEPSEQDIHSLVDEAKPIVAGFKHELEEYDFENLEKRVLRAVTERQNASDHSSTTVTNPTTLVSEKVILKTSGNFFLGTENIGKDERREITDKKYVKESDNITKNKISTTEMYMTHTEMTNDEQTPDEENYDYKQFKAEYYAQIESSKKDNKTFNYTDSGEPEETAKDAMRKIVDFKIPRNCTREELTQFSAKALECLAHDYKTAKSEKNVKKILSRTWLVLKIWICIYLCIAMPCWCLKGWCCCCFNCALCRPEQTIRKAKKYYAENPPGILTEHEGVEKNESKTTEFEATLFELEAYEKFESAIRNL